MKSFSEFIPYRKRPLCFCDVETTGNRPGYHEITEIAFIHDEKGSLCLQIAPQHLDRADPEALRISRFNTSDWAEAPSFKEAASRIAEFFDGATVIGHNFAGYDVPMIRGNFEMVGLTHDRLFRDIVDTQILARTFLVPIGLNRIGMEFCRKFFNRSYEGAHSAYDDAVFAKELYFDIIGNLKWHGKRDGKRIQETLFAEG